MDYLDSIPEQPWASKFNGGKELRHDQVLMTNQDGDETLVVDFGTLKNFMNENSSWKVATIDNITNLLSDSINHDFAESLQKKEYDEGEEENIKPDDFSPTSDPVVDAINSHDNKDTSDSTVGAVDISESVVRANKLTFRSVGSDNTYKDITRLGLPVSDIQEVASYEESPGEIKQEVHFFDGKVSEDQQIKIFDIPNDKGVQRKTTLCKFVTTDNHFCKFCSNGKPEKCGFATSNDDMQRNFPSRILAKNMIPGQMKKVLKDELKCPVEIESGLLYNQNWQYLFTDTSALYCPGGSFLNEVRVALSAFHNSRLCLADSSEVKHRHIFWFS